jgi:alpha-L-fucosidase 2
MVCCVRAETEAALKLWYQQPATRFYESAPLGNGRIGAMVFGGVDEERIILNESSVWSGSPQHADRDGSHAYLPEIRRLLREGKNPEAEALVNQHFTCVPPGSGAAVGANIQYGCYQVLGNLRLRFEHRAAVPSGEANLVAKMSNPTGYRRTLDLQSAMAGVEYEINGVKFDRRHFVSAPDEVLVSRLICSKPAGISFAMILDRAERFTTMGVGNDELLMTGTLNDGRGGKGLTHVTRVRVVAKAGTVTAQGNELRVKNADEVMILVAAGTDYRGFGGRQTADPLAATRKDVDRAAAKSYDALLAAQRKDYRKYFDRVSLQLGNSSSDNITNKPTDRRLQDFSKGATDPALAGLYFNFGRYLLISSSRPGGLPANLQGIWAEEIQTPWNADWHLNINVQMNYWPALVGNLAELQDPLDALIGSLVGPGAKTAQAYYKARGWIAHVITNPWGFTSLGEQADWGATTGGSSWLCEHLWSRYDYTRDKAYLARMYPILKGSAQFYLDNLMEEPRHGWLVTGPSNSPENAFIMSDGRRANLCMGPTIDMQQLRELFGNTAQAAEILGVDADLRQELLAKRAKLAPNQIGPDGRLQEWLEPYGEHDPTHRHVSHLYGVYPYHEITIEGTPDLAAAARKSLEARGDNVGVGWSLAWKMNFWARLQDGDRAHKLLTMLLNPTSDAAGSAVNLLCFCPPFQIEGNFGGAAGIAEMLLQSHPDNGAPDAFPVIRLLPALPKAWASGTVKGFRARGNIEVDIQWQDRKLLKATLHPKQDGLYRVRYQDKVVEIKLKGGRTATLNSALTPEQGS